MIIRFEVHHHLHPGLSDSGKLNADRFPPTQCGLALAQDWAAYKTISLQGSYGSAYSQVYVRLRDAVDAASAAAVPLCDVPGEALDALPMGTIRVADWEDMTSRVWDGNNHVLCEPARSMRLWARLQFTRAHGQQTSA